MGDGWGTDPLSGKIPQNVGNNERAWGTPFGDAHSAAKACLELGRFVKGRSGRRKLWGSQVTKRKAKEKL
jgi:hypothetical protein